MNRATITEFLEKITNGMYGPYKTIYSVSLIVQDKKFKTYDLTVYAIDNKTFSRIGETGEFDAQAYKVPALVDQQLRITVNVSDIRPERFANRQRVLVALPEEAFYTSPSGEAFLYHRYPLTEYHSRKLTFVGNEIANNTITRYPRSDYINLYYIATRENRMDIVLRSKSGRFRRVIQCKIDLKNNDFVVSYPQFVARTEEINNEGY